MIFFFESHFDDFEELSTYFGIYMFLAGVILVIQKVSIITKI